MGVIIFADSEHGIFAVFQIFGGINKVADILHGYTGLVISFLVVVRIFAGYFTLITTYQGRIPIRPSDLNNRHIIIAIITVPAPWPIPSAEETVFMGLLCRKLSFCFHYVVKQLSDLPTDEVK